MIGMWLVSIAWLDHIGLALHVSITYRAPSHGSISGSQCSVDQK